MQNPLFQRNPEMSDKNGPQSNYRKVKFPIISNRIGQGRMTTDKLGLGSQCTPQAKIPDVKENCVKGLWCRSDEKSGFVGNHRDERYKRTGIRNFRIIKSVFGFKKTQN
jgi:hypothetical protein